MPEINKADERILACNKATLLISSTEIASELCALCNWGYSVDIICPISTVTLLSSKMEFPLVWVDCAILVLFLLYASRKLKSDSINAKKTLRATLLLYTVLMAYMLVMSIFPHPDIPSVYYPLFLLIAPVLFILPAYQHVVMTLSSLALFFLLVLHFKSPVCWSHELFEASTAALFSIIVIVFMTQFRLQSDCLKKKYYQLSRQDALTGIVNKTAGFESAQAYLTEMGETESCALLFVDIDSFKTFNDTFGHLEGDHMLKKIGTTLSQLCRKDDVVSRFGGDEFIILLKDIQSETMAQQKASSIIDAVAKINGDHSKQTTCSIGICYNAHQYSTIEEMIHRADIALYRAKNNNKNCFVTYSEKDGNGSCGMEHTHDNATNDQCM